MSSLPRRERHGKSQIGYRSGRGRPCPVCTAGSKGCSATADGLHFCRGEPGPGWRRVSKTPDPAGFHSYRRDDGPPAASRTPRPPQTPTDWPALAAKYSRDLTPALKAKLAGDLGLPVGAIDAIPQVGFDGTAFTFTEVDAGGAVIGVSRRHADGRKTMVRGSRRGLTLPSGWRDQDGPVYVVEGPTDVLAMAAAGLVAVGRPSNSGGAVLLADLFGGLSSERRPVVLGEDDRKADGTWPGKDGAEAVARVLAAKINRPVRVALPPPGAKDVRAWLTDPARGNTPWPDRGAVLVARQSILGTADPPGVPGGDGPVEGKAAVADILAGIGTEADLWHDPTGSGFATAGQRTYPVRSKAFKNHLIHEYRSRAGGKVPNAEAVSNALNAIEAAAVHDGPEHPVFVRVAKQEDKLYLHLADADDTVIEIDADGWRVSAGPPVRFRKNSGMKPLPMPQPGGNLVDLRRLLNIPDDDLFAVLCAWLTAALGPDGPYPALVLLGEQGSAKSTTAKLLKALIDPSAAPVRCEPRDGRDLMIHARNEQVLAFDNVSGLPPWLSDALCRLATGGGFGTRELYSDDAEVIFDAMRPVILNGIEDFVTRADLLEQSLLLRHPPIPESARRPEAEVWAAFRAAHPKLLGALLDRVAGGLRELPELKLGTLPRMADFAKFGVACEAGAEERPRFLAAYADNQRGAHEQALDASSLTPALLLLVEGRSGWRGKAAALLNELNRFSPNPPPRDWPKKPNALTGKLRRLAPNLRKVYGLEVDCDGKESDRNRTRVVTITRQPEADKEPRLAHPEGAGGSGDRVDSGGRSPGIVGRSSSPSPSDGRAGKDRRPDGADGADGADDDSRSFSGRGDAVTVPPTATQQSSRCDPSGHGPTVPPRRRFGNNPNRGTALDWEGGRS